MSIEPLAYMLLVDSQRIPNFPLADLRAYLRDLHARALRDVLVHV